MSSHGYNTRSAAGAVPQTLPPTRPARTTSESRQTRMEDFFTTRPKSSSRGSEVQEDRHGQVPKTLSATEQVLERLTTLLELQAFKQEDSPKPERHEVRPIKRPEARAPDTFTGESASKLEAFLTSCDIIFLNHEAAFPRGRDKVIYASSFFKDSAQKWFRPIMQNPTPGNEILMENWGIFVASLRKQFGDPNRFRTAEYQLNTLHMKNDEYISHYITRFRLIASELGSEWPDKPLCFAFRSGLPERILDELARSDEPANLSELLEVCQKTYS